MKVYCINGGGDFDRMSRTHLFHFKSTVLIHGDVDKIKLSHFQSVETPYFKLA